MTSKPKNLSLKSPEIFLLSVAGVGFAPKAPGTMGSLVTLPFLYALGLLGFPSVFLIPVLAILTCVSCYITENVQKEYGLHDPSWIVFDEVLGMAVAWLFVASSDPLSLLVIFGLFRAFDIYKIWPASWLDRYEHGSGTILDDIVSGVYAGLTYLLLAYFWPSLA